MKKLFVLIILLAILGGAYEYSLRSNQPVPAIDTESPIANETGSNNTPFKVTLFGGIGVAQAQGQSYLTDQDGHTLYIDTNDEGRKSTEKPACNSECEKTWIPYLYDGVSGGIAPGSKDPLLSRFNIYTRADGQKQYSLGTKPLYRYVY
jgi:predicted lipoprotein with Yx(FWY)xxD motif